MSFDQDRSNFERLLTQYQSEFEEEVAFKSRMLDLLTFENCFERSLLHAHFTGSAWVIDPSSKKFLMTHHAKLNKWLQLGGHADGDANMQRVAFKELLEESGSEEFSLQSEHIFDVDIHTIPERKGVPEHDHYDVRFLFIGDASKPLFKNHESKELRWVSSEELTDLIEPNSSISRMLNKSLQMAF